ncbi:MAG: UPF0175 family protein [Candidatus Pacearchaeota archaeon]|nr:UPF0175 family protein [Candidatus Pacearchaeota archaeon]
MYENIGTRISKDILKDIEYLAKEEKTDKSKIMRELLDLAVKNKLFEIALEKYFKREISFGRAAELSRLPLSDFMKMAAEKKVSLNYSIVSLENDFKSALKVKNS